MASSASTAASVVVSARGGAWTRVGTIRIVLVQSGLVQDGLSQAIARTRDRTRRVSARSQPCRKTTAARPRPTKELTVTARPLSSLAALLLALLAFAATAGAATPGPNGRIAFSSTQDGGSNNSELYSAAPDGSDVKRLTGTSGWEQNPAWSPDGTRLAYERLDPGARRKLFVMSADGSAQTLLSPPAGST